MEAEAISRELEIQKGPPLTAAEVLAHVAVIKDIMTNVMKKDVHYGVIPGTDKPALYKAGAEKLNLTFKLTSEVQVEDLSHGDEIRYRSLVKLFDRSGHCLGWGIGECSSNEEKYKWRKAVCDDEWDETDLMSRRVKWKMYQGKPYQVKQIRTNPADEANTVLKMSKKRASVDATLTSTGASDIFDQDTEDKESGTVEQGEKGPKSPRRKSNGDKAKPGNIISEPQRKRLYAIATNALRTEDEVKAHLLKTYGIESTKDILKTDYEAIVKWAGSREPGTDG